jgi:hypothetical protein
VNDGAERAQNADARHPAERDALQRGRHVSAAQHGRREHHHDHFVRRTVLILGPLAGCGAPFGLVAADRISLRSLFHFYLQTVLKFAFSQTYADGDASDIRLFLTISRMAEVDF